MSGMRSNEFSWLKRKVSKYFQSACFHQQTFVLAIFDDFEKWTDIAFLGAMECSTCLLLVTPPPFLVGLLLALSLKSKLTSTVLGPWFIDTLRPKHKQ